jgi:hypothetical protein
MELIIVLIALAVLILMIRKVGVNEPNKNTVSNSQPNIPQNIPTQNSSSTLDNLTKAGLIGTAAGLGMIGAGMLLNRNNYYNYYNYYNPYNNDTSLADHLHDLIWDNDCNKCDNDVIYNIFSSCDDTNPFDDSSCNNSWDFDYDSNNNDDSYSWNSWDNGDDSSW